LVHPYVLDSAPGWLITEKPAGLLSVPGRGPEKADCLYTRLQKEYPTILVVHRLDQATSGLMVWALNKEVQRQLGRQFEDRIVYKEYQALISARLPEGKERLELRQRLDVEHRPLQIVDEIQGKISVTRWRVLEELPGGIYRVQLLPETGRTHQLRLHMATLKAPILGDQLYGGPEYTRMALHACVLEFEDPETGSIRRFESPVPF
jgi:tRNA pseudouridine32 synthase/23S rRNA pseudouridine746 synthase